MGKYPIFLELKGQRAVIIGGGLVAARKAQALLDAQARLVVVAEKIDDTVKAVCQNTDAQLIESTYNKQYLPQSLLVIAATDNQQLNRQIFADCAELGILCNVVDEPDICHFYVPAVIKHSSLQIAISTDGKCPAYAGHLRRKLQDIITEQHGQFCDDLEKMRQKILKEIPSEAAKKTTLGKLVNDDSFDLYKEKGPSEWFKWAENLVVQSKNDAET